MVDIIKGNFTFKPVEKKEEDTKRKILPSELKVCTKQLNSFTTGGYMMVFKEREKKKNRIPANTDDTKRH